MKRKIFNMFMVGALVLPSASMFVSCKDYDDDINNLQQQIDELSKTIKAIQDQIAAGSVITNVTPTGNGVTITLSNNKTFTITNGKDGVAGKDGTAWTIGTDGYWYKDGVKTTYYALGTKGDAGAAGATGTKGDTGATGVPGIYYVPNATTGCFDIYNGDGTYKEATKISWKATDVNAITAVKNDGENTLTLTNVESAGETKTVVIDLTGKLHGLVLNPDTYYQGIQALDCATYAYNAITVSDQDLIKKDNNLTYSTPDLTATYFLNPSNAKMDYKDLTKYSFVAYNKSYTRAGENISEYIKVAQAVAVADGSMKVSAKYNQDAIKSIANDNEVTLLALQYKADKDETVTSDFAAIRATQYTNPELEAGSTALSINIKEREIRQKLIDNGVSLTTVLLASNLTSEVNSPATISVPYNYTEVDQNGVKLGDIVSTFMTAATRQEVIPNSTNGFKYEFEIMHTTASDGTKQEYHVDGNCSDGYFKPVNKESSIGREPVVRVELVDTNNGNKIAAVGYLKIKIADKNVEPQAPFVTAFNSSDSYNVASQNDAAVVNIKTTPWKDVETAILDGVKMSKADFDDNYALQTNDGGVAKQYNTDKTEKIESVGTITFDKNEGDLTTNSFTWNITSAQAYKLLKNGAKEVITSVCFKKTGSKGTYENIYVNFVWTPNSIVTVPSSVDLSKYEIGASWNDNTLGCTVLGNDDYSCQMSKYLQEINAKAPYEKDFVHTQFSFANTQNSGFSVDKTGLIAYYDKVEIAKIDGNNIVYIHNETAEKLLNGGKALLNIETKAYIGDKLVYIPIENSIFKIKFRPQISVAFNQIASVEDRHSAERELIFTADENYLNWGMKSISLDTKHCSADQSITDEELNGLFTYESLNSVVSGKPFGKLTFNHVGGADFTKDINVTIPVEIVYSWGTYNTSIKVTINKQTSAAKRR